MFDMAVECGAAINIENNQVLKSYFLKGDIHTFLGSSCTTTKFKFMLNFGHLFLNL